MQDEQRADLLVDALANRHTDAIGIDDAELIALIDLGVELEHLGEAIASLEQADAALSPIFTRELHATLMAEHPGTARAPSSASARAPHAAIAKARSTWRRLALLAITLAAIVAVTLATLLHGNQPAFVGTGAVTSTVSRPNILAFGSTARGPASATADSGARLHTMAPRASASPQPSRAKLPATNHAAIAPTMRGTASLSTAASDAFGVPPGAKLVLPATLPALPARAPVYLLRYQAMSAQDLQAIAHDFFGPHTNLHDGITTMHDGDSLTVTAATGEITYDAAARRPAAHQSPAVATARNLALQWIRAHGLSTPSLLTANMAQTVSGNNVTVRFRPKLPYAIADSSTPFEVTLTIDATGRVTHAHRLWPQFVQSTVATLVGLGAASMGVHAAAVPSAGAAPSSAQAARARVLQMVSATVIYVLEPANGAGQLSPYYRLETREPGARATTTVILPATAARP